MKHAERRGIEDHIPRNTSLFIDIFAYVYSRTCDWHVGCNSLGIETTRGNSTMLDIITTSVLEAQYHETYASVSRRQLSIQQDLETAVYGFSLFDLEDDEGVIPSWSN